MPSRNGRKDVRTRKSSPEVPDVYRDMLADSGLQDHHPVKRRRVGGQLISTPRPDELIQHPSADSLFDEAGDIPDVTLSDTRAEESSDSEVAWEEVGIPTQPISVNPASDVDNQPAELELTLQRSEQDKGTRARTSRKALTKAERKLRLDVHKIHICCLLSHASIRNHWCNDDNVQNAVKSIVTDKILSYLNAARSGTQFQKSRCLMEALSLCSQTFRSRFQITARGLTKAYWALNAPEEDRSTLNPELPIEQEDFLSAARELEGSRDLGAQLFCAFLRALGLQVRLVVSLQPLAFRSDANRTTGEGVRRSRPESRFPVYWVEVLNQAVRKWLPIDPLVTQTIAKPSKLEPPWSDVHNIMTYVIAFEEHGHAIDVTTRYARTYTAKTRPNRVEFTAAGDRWMELTMARFQRRYLVDVDIAEEEELAQRLAREPMPRNLQDFKRHPLYVLERDLGANEVLTTCKEVGRVGIGPGHNFTKTAAVFRRSEVRKVQSGAQWWRQGRVIREDAVSRPMKFSGTRASDKASDRENEDELVMPGTALYSYEQTQLYEPPGVVDGRVPKNKFGNIDIYTKSMIPTGSTHLRHPHAIRAAQAAGIDFASAVVGFTFRARQSRPTLDGIIVPTDSKGTLYAKIRAFDEEEAERKRDSRIGLFLGMWQKFYTILKIRKRINSYSAEADPSKAETSGQTLTPEHKSTSGQDKHSSEEDTLDLKAVSRSKLPHDAGRVEMMSNIWTDISIPAAAFKPPSRTSFVLPSMNIFEDRPQDDKIDNHTDANCKSAAHELSVNDARQDNCGSLATTDTLQSRNTHGCGDNQSAQSAQFLHLANDEEEHLSRTNVSNIEVDDKSGKARPQHQGPAEPVSSMISPASSHSDAGSLLSQDPDQDDDDPEWID